jgi:protein-tyrosine phosphatase
LPDLDDGPETDEESLAMARQAVQEGISTIVVTPHASFVQKAGGRIGLGDRVRGFQALLDSNHVPLRLAVGAEHMLVPELLTLAREGGLITINGSAYLLVELDFFQYPPYADDALFKLQLKGITPVLAHPERQATIQKDPGVLERLVERGVVTQITACSLTGGMGVVSQKSAYELLKLGLVHCVASDAHRAIGNRCPLLGGVFHVLSERVGEEDARVLLEENPKAVAQGKPVAAMSVAAKKKLWMGWSRPSQGEG